MNELKKCPFCNTGTEKDEFPFFKHKPTCIMSVSNSTVSEEKWNNRPIEDKLKAEIEELRSDMEYVTTVLQNVDLALQDNDIDRAKQALKETK